jgi:hypothetical protein
LMPVSSISRRFSIGMVHLFESLGKCSFLPISEISYSRVIPRGRCPFGLSMTFLSYLSRSRCLTAPSTRTYFHCVAAVGQTWPLIEHIPPNRHSQAH